MVLVHDEVHAGVDDMEDSRQRLAAVAVVVAVVAVLTVDLGLLSALCHDDGNHPHQEHSSMPGSDSYPLAW